MVSEQLIGNVDLDASCDVMKLERMSHEAALPVAEDVGALVVVTLEHTLSLLTPRTCRALGPAW
jgi:hypothetical protein